LSPYPLCRACEIGLGAWLRAGARALALQCRERRGHFSDRRPGRPNSQVASHADEALEVERAQHEDAGVDEDGIETLRQQQLEQAQLAAAEVLGVREVCTSFCASSEAARLDALMIH